MAEQLRQIRRALLSVSDKQNILQFAQFLQSKNVEILSTGGTAKLLKEHHITVTEVSEHTGFPEMMDGRVKTLHPKIHGGILGRRDKDKAVMQDNKIDEIDLVVVNLYPFEQTIAKKNCSLEEAIENIDIGGPTMIRAAAKNYADVTVLVDIEDYTLVMQEIDQHQGTTLATRKYLSSKVFHLMARYEGAISNYLAAAIDQKDAQVAVKNIQLSKHQDLRYGENPHQQAAFYKHSSTLTGSIADAKLLQGKAMSYNNIADADAAWQCVNEFDETCCVIVKHANPCGVAIDDDLLSAYQKAYQSDPTSAFGGIIAFNKSLDAVTAKKILEQQFVEVIIAPNIDQDALPVLATKSNIRVLNTGSLLDKDQISDEIKVVSGGMLVQTSDKARLSTEELKQVSELTASHELIEDLLFAWKVVKFTKSNAIVFAKNKQTIGIGAGQMSRVYSAKIAAIKAQEEKFDIQGAVMASDAFFPFRDTVDNAHEIGIKAIIQPGGSMRDNEVILAADEHNMVMMFTGIRHFKH